MYVNNNDELIELGWLSSRSTLGTSTYVGHDVSLAAHSTKWSSYIL